MHHFEGCYMTVAHQKNVADFVASTVCSPKNAQKGPGKKTNTFDTHADMLKLKFCPCLMAMQSVKTGLYRTFFLQGEAAGQF